MNLLFQPDIKKKRTLHLSVCMFLEALSTRAIQDVNIIATVKQSLVSLVTRKML